MKIYLDRRACPCWEAACESDFASRLERVMTEEFISACLLELVHDGDPDITFDIIERDSSKKTLVVNHENHPDAIDSWMLLWEKQEQNRQTAAN